MTETTTTIPSTVPNLYPIVLDLSQYETELCKVAAAANSCGGCCSPMEFIHDIMTCQREQVENDKIVISEDGKFDEDKNLVSSNNDNPTTTDKTTTSSSSSSDNKNDIELVVPTKPTNSHSFPYVSSQQQQQQQEKRGWNNIFQMKQQSLQHQHKRGGSMGRNEISIKTTNYYNTLKTHRRSVSDSCNKSSYLLASKSSISNISEEVFAPLLTGYFEDHFVLTRQMFRSNRSCVWECVHRKSGQRYCVKIVNKDACDEIDMLQAAQSHSNILELKQIMKTKDKNYCMVTELMFGGNLLSRVIQEKHFNEEKARNCTYQILLGLKHLHQTMCHNNLNPSNILLDAQGNNIKIADFGSAVMINTDDDVTITTPIASSNTSGRLLYRSPECIASTEADMWSVGVLLFFMLFGHEQVETLTSDQILYKLHYNHPPGWDHISRQAKQFLTSVLHMDPSIRLTAEEALQHPWLSNLSLSTTETREQDILQQHDNVKHRRHNSAGSYTKIIARSLSRILSTSTTIVLRSCKTDDDTTTLSRNNNVLITKQHHSNNISKRQAE